MINSTTLHLYSFHNSSWDIPEPCKIVVIKNTPPQSLKFYPIIWIMVVIKSLSLKSWPENSFLWNYNYFILITIFIYSVKILAFGSIYFTFPTVSWHDVVILYRLSRFFTGCKMIPYYLFNLFLSVSTFSYQMAFVIR